MGAHFRYAEHLDAVIRNHIVYRFHPNGANVIYYTAKALQQFRLGYMGFIQSAKLYTGQYDTHEYYIPKTRRFTQDDITYDFRSLQDYSFRLPSPLRFMPGNKNIEDAENLPDRFIQFLGRKKDGKTVISFELSRPKNDKAAAKLDKALATLKAAGPDYVSVTFGAGDDGQGAARRQPPAPLRPPTTPAP